MIAGMKRTPIGRFLGGLSDVPGSQLGAVSAKAAITQSGVGTDSISECIMGTMVPAGTGQVPSRQVALHSGLAESTVCTTINKACASGMKAISLAAQSVMLGEHQAVLAGGFESMSRVPHYVFMRKGVAYSNATLIDGVAFDGLTDAFNGMMMGNCAEKTASELSITREMQDEFALESYERARAAQANGTFEWEIAPVTVEGRKGPQQVTADEECQKFAPDKFPALKPAFVKNGTITPANASKLNDGACTAVLTSEDFASAQGLKPLARIVASADAENAPIDFSIAPVGAVRRVLEKAGLTAQDIDYFEVNEAFSAVALANMKLLEMDWAKTNVHGGAVALGHPVGASGARIVLSLINVLRSNNAKRGLAAICNGGGGASAMIVELL